MKNRIKKSLSLLLAVIMLLCAVPMNGSAASISLNRPLDKAYPITAREYYSSGKRHGAIDYGCSKGTPVYAAESGTVTVHDGGYGDGYSGCKDGNGWGNYIDISHGNGYSTRYAHMSTGRFVVKSGSSVGRGQLIGYSGNSGNSSGPHLHFGLYLNGNKVYPESYIKTATGYYSGSISHTHSYAEHYESAHPHKKYMKCSCGDWYYTGATTYVDSCSDCWNLNRVDVWVSNVDKTAEISEGIVQNQYQFWFKLANKDTGALYNSYGSTRGYKSKISVYNPDGSELFSYTYDDSDYNWIRAVPKQLGNYKVRIELSGNITADYYEYFTVKSDIKIHFEDTSRLTVVEGQSKTFKAWADGNWPDGTTVDWSINNEIATAELKSGTVTITGVKQGLALYVLSAYDPDKNVIASESRWIKVVPSTYTITYNANGGSGAPSSQKKEYGKTLTLSSTKPTRNGYTFLGWSTSSSATSATYSAGASYSANADVTLYAVWKANTYTLTYDGNGFSSYSSKVNNVSTTTIKTDMPNRFGYNFNGWAKSKNGSAEYMPGASITLTANTTLYAVWSQDSMSSGTNFASIILAKGGINYYKFVPTKSGKYVVYSKGDKDPKVTLYNSSGTELAKNDDGGENKNFRLVYDLQAGTTYYYAFDFYGSSSFNVGFISVRFGPVYNISYNANGGSGVPSSQSKDWNKDIALSSTVPTRSGYTFLGWSTSSSATSATYKAGATYSANSNATLYAVWSKNTYTLSFNASGGTGAPQNMIGNTTYTIPSTVPKRFGWNFQGWRYLNDSGSYTYYKPGDKITINKNTTLTASWGGTSFSYPGVEAYSQINYPGEIHYIEYTSITTGKYVIYSYGEDDTYGYLYDSQGNILASNDDGGDGRNFRIEYNFIEGKTYYFGIKYYSSSKVGAIHSNFGRVYTINYNANGGSGAPASQSKDWNKNISLSTAIPTRKGYTFLGWSICGSISNPEVSVTFKAGATYSTNGNMTLYAVWKSNPCSHTYNSGKITTAATCKTTGVKTYTCTICKATKTETIAKNPANHVGGTKVKNATAATCTAKGYTGDTYCLGCGVVTVKGKDIAVKAHSYNSGKITTAATCKSTGVKTYTCTVCKATKTETIAKNPANHVGGTAVKNAKNATCTAKGYTGDTYCLGCGVVTVKGTEISALGHTDSNSDGKCDRCGITLGEPEKPNTPDTPASNCTHLCHKGGFIWRIVRFFWKLFKINRNCSCGVAHY